MLTGVFHFVWKRSLLHKQFMLKLTSRQFALFKFVRKTSSGWEAYSKAANNWTNNWHKHVHTTWTCLSNHTYASAWYINLATKTEPAMWQIRTSCTYCAMCAYSVVETWTHSTNAFGKVIDNTRYQVKTQIYSLVRMKLNLQRNTFCQ